MINILKMASRREMFLKFLFVGLFFLHASEFTMVSGEGGEIQTVRCIERERRALLSFKLDLVDDYGRLSSWENEEDCCKWRGVRCSNHTGHVTMLHLSSNFDQSDIPLRGKVSDSLLELHHLNYLDLSYNDFEYSRIPKFIGSFTKLTYLNLSWASFTGEVPPQLGNLTNLRYLDLSYSSFDLNAKNLEWFSHLSFLRYLDLSGVSLAFATDWLQAISSLPSLVELYLRECNLPPAILSPSLLSVNYSSSSLSILDLFANDLTPTSIYPWLFNLSSSLTKVNLAFNSLQGPTPEAFGNFSHLCSLDLSANYLSEPLLKFLKKLSRNVENSLEHLDLRGNLFSGSLPDITRFSSLKFLGLSTNQLTGSLGENIGQLHQLEVLDVSSNLLEGVISETHLANLSNLKQLGLSRNSFSLNISANWTPPFQLDVIGLGNCGMGPDFPKWLQTQKNFYIIDISSAGISDSMPTWFWDLSSRIQQSNLSHNQIGGMLPDLSKSFSGHDYFLMIDLSYNCFEGIVPLVPQYVWVLYLSNNRFTGSTSFLCSLGNETYLSFLDLSSNMLSGELPDCWMHLKLLSSLNLANNNFSGKIPNSLGFISNYRVKILLLRNNSFKGELPSSLKNLGSLNVFDVSRNKLSGNIPVWVGTHLSQLGVLSLRNNGFYGSIPSQLCQLNQIQVLDLSQNNLLGNIPQCFNNFTALAKANSSNEVIYDFEMPGYTGDFLFIANVFVYWKSQELEYTKTLDQLKIIDLSSNKLVGEIPQEIASLVGLISLNLSRNKLEGNIMHKIGEMEMLEILDLSRNHLSGEIPTSLSNLHFLDVLDLSNNNFSGRIPTSTQLQSFDPSAYARNNHLCGNPLAKCPGDKTAPISPVNAQKNDNEEEDDDWLWTPEFYMSMGIGFFVGFSTIFGSMLFKDSWRQAYFKSLNNLKEWIYLQIALRVTKLRRKFQI